ncbi:MAG: hypothetical protein M5U26_03420 [Planctomycetota bacterium]|nr:hypothetical protein [Planctomycetota bacterium]
MRPSKKDPRWFEFDDGTFFYPLGHNVHSPVDLRCWEAVFHEPPPLSRGLNLYKDFFPKMQAAGENVGEVWMSSWWLGIEWTRRWRGYHGPGRYSLEHAWKLDRVLELARQHGIRVHLVLDNHGKLSEWCDWEWPTNPFNRTTEPGGLVDRPSEYFTNAACRQMHKRRMRYIAARWGSDSTVMGWELMSEMDLVGDGSSTSRGPIGRAVDGNLHRHPTTQAWITEMMQALKEYDPYGRPVTTHYARNFNGVDKQLAGTPLFDYIVCVGYRPTPGFANLALQTSENLTPHGKPFWVTEFGGEWNATSMPRLEADLHCGLWSSWMTNAAGSPLFWWYDFIDKKGLYDHYKAFSKYVQGEDRRGLETQTERVTFTRRSGGLAGLQCRWKEGAYVWIYDEAAMNELPPREPRALRECRREAHGSRPRQVPPGVLGHLVRKRAGHEAGRGRPRPAARDRPAHLPWRLGAQGQARLGRRRRPRQLP